MIGFFFSRPKPAKKVTVRSGNARRSRQSGGMLPAEPVVEEVIVEDGEDVNEVDLAADDPDASNPGGNDPSKAAHDAQVVRSVHEQAIRDCSILYGIDLTPETRKEALGVFPKVAGLARRVHDSATLFEKFNRLVAADPAMLGQKRTLDRRVATRWNSELACLSAHIHFKKQVKQLTNDDENALDAYALSPSQWKLAEDLVSVLEIFDTPTKLFSKNEVPLICETIPMLETFEAQLVAVCDQKHAQLPPIIRVAAQASLLVVGKYYALSDDNEIYRIAMVLCPWRKLQWFAVRQWSAEDISTVKAITIRTFREIYAGDSNNTEAVGASSTAIAAPLKRQVSVQVYTRSFV
ncbi:hypothetical protein PUNSTDRAFT_74871 [Punctularia strigosozonata HHB-11173 SS5]|uniref:hAT-like transposase RNase-H fold domain-containing protein n=1 Tax=Punctularia strigosozonata (strain HHB-11173) TaxID=741275 RepID=R7S5H6_PUNST|nr:uncharacterized protein PUNSTDRAFT_74871 [Punctularia strigosozonata HHB-11173 SS5]EIN05207.1 hypothetical protein PUNSTDRAFT_74871 [Punctularia strigosozonata HHB-11173 SS5]